MYRKKVYGQSQDTTCTFCESRALLQTAEKLPCCKNHKDKQLGVIHCVCGNILDLKFSKYGPFFTCEKCGAVSFSKGMDLKDNAVPSGTGFKLNAKYRQSMERTKAALQKPEVDNASYIDKQLRGGKERSPKDLWKDYYGV